MYLAIIFFHFWKMLNLKTNFLKKKTPASRIVFLKAMELNFENAKRKENIGLQKEDAEEGKCGKLLESMCGARDAAQNWEIEYNKFLSKAGFKRGVSSRLISQGLLSCVSVAQLPNV